MLQTSLRHTEVAQSLFVLHFAIAICPKETCERGGQSVSYYLTVHNPTWGVRIKNFTAKYTSDTAAARICPWLELVRCPEGGQEVILRIPSVPQEYWEGDQKTLVARACIADGVGDVDFNVSCKIHAEYDVRGAAWDASLSPDFVSNLHVKVS